jgi:hypothetical protein
MSVLKAILAINPNANVRVDNNDVNQIEWFDTTPIANSEIEAKVTELKAKAVQDKTDKENNIASGKQKLLDLGLTEDEIKALIGV